MGSMGSPLCFYPVHTSFCQFSHATKRLSRSFLRQWYGDECHFQSLGKHWFLDVIQGQCYALWLEAQLITSSTSSVGASNHAFEGLFSTILRQFAAWPSSLLWQKDSEATHRTPDRLQFLTIFFSQICDIKIVTNAQRHKLATFE